MPEFTGEVRISAPAARIFDLVTDFARYPEIFRAIRGVDVLTNGPLDVGTRFRETRVLFGREASEEMIVTRLIRPRELALESLIHGVRYRSRLTFSADDPETVVTLAFEAAPKTPLAKTLGFLGGPMIAATRRAGVEDLAALKKAAEASSRIDARTGSARRDRYIVV
ncbi:MAG: SRPBCC family protein [Armatimonadetes bacterium]|nr:SRPBCC family protein [Armatimonadota bacterium]